MIRELKAQHSYKKVMLILSILTFSFGLAFGIIGEVFLPFASAFLAALFLFEKPEIRFLSYLVPLSTVTICVMIKGIYALISIEYVLLALIIIFCYIHSKSKAECSLYLTLTVSIFVLISLYLGAGTAIGSLAPEKIIEHYNEMYLDFKAAFVDFFSKYSATLEDGATQSLLTNEEILSYFDSLTVLAVSVVAIFSFAISGVAIKIFTKTALTISNKGILKTFAHFIPSTLTAYSYIAAVILSIFASTDDIFGASVANVNQILMIVFAYMGAQYLIAIFKASERKSTTLIIFLGAFVLLPGVALQILSYLGVFLTINTNKQLDFLSKNK